MAVGGIFDSRRRSGGKTGGSRGPGGGAGAAPAGRAPPARLRGGVRVLRRLNAEHWMGHWMGEHTRPRLSLDAPRVQPGVSRRAVRAGKRTGIRDVLRAGAPNCTRRLPAGRQAGACGPHSIQFFGLDGPGRLRPELSSRTGGASPAARPGRAQPRKTRVRDLPDHRMVLLSRQTRITMPDTARLLERAQAGDALAARELLPVVYDELRRLAAQKLAAEPPGHTLQPTALVHEAWLRLAGQEGARFESRTHFFAAAAEAMRHILVERARRRLAAKRGGGAQPAELEEIEIPAPAADDTRLLAVHEALEKFAALDPRKAELVKLRYFVGMTYEEAAEALGIAVPTAKQWWAYARAWLTVELSGKTGFF